VRLDRGSLLPPIVLGLVGGLLLRVARWVQLVDDARVEIE
jgi:hypothetical protein